MAADGDWYACHRAVGDERYRLGSASTLDGNRGRLFLEARLRRIAGSVGRVICARAAVIRKHRCEALRAAISFAAGYDSGKAPNDLERPAAIALEFLDFITAMIRHDRFTSTPIISDGGR